MADRSETPTDVHVYPTNDFREHETSRKCWCHPEEDEPGLFVHNSMDRREDYEEGKRMKS